MATTADPIKALHQAHDAAVAAITKIGDPTTRYTAIADLAAWHHDRATSLLTDPPQPAPVDEADEAKATKAAPKS